MGYGGFEIITQNGREYLAAYEYLCGEGGIAHGVGLAAFLLDWDESGQPTVLEFTVES